MNSVSVNLHNCCNKLVNLHNYTQTDVVIFKQNYTHSTHFSIIQKLMCYVRNYIVY